MTSHNTIVAFDIETTGLDHEIDRIIQFSAIKFEKETYKIIDSINYMIKPLGDYKMSIGAYMKHKISPQILQDKKYFKDYAQEIYDFLNDSDLLTYNGCSCDIPFLNKEFSLLGITFDFKDRECYDSYLIESRRHGNKLEDVYKRYKGKSMEEAGLVTHNALSDVKATISVFVAQNKEEPVQSETLLTIDNKISKVEFNGKEYTCLNFGKYRNIPLMIVIKHDSQYITWLLSEKSKISQEVKEIVRQFL